MRLYGVSRSLAAVALDEFGPFPAASRQLRRPIRLRRGGMCQILFGQMSRGRNGRTSALPSRSLNIGSGIDRVHECLHLSARSRDVPACHVFPTTLVPLDYERCPMHLPRSVDAISWRLC